MCYIMNILQSSFEKIIGDIIISPLGSFYG